MNETESVAAFRKSIVATWESCKALLVDVWKSIKKWVFKAADAIIAAVGGRLHPKWLLYYRHSKKARIRRKYRT